MNTVSMQTGEAVEHEAVTDLPVNPGQGTTRRMGDEFCAGIVTGSCGETIEIYIKVDKEVVTDAAFYTDGCQFSVLCGYLAARQAIGKTIEEAAEVEGDTILELVKGIPPTETHCAYLAASALHAAIHEWVIKDKKTLENQEVS